MSLTYLPGPRLQALEFGVHGNASAIDLMMNLCVVLLADQKSWVAHLRTICKRGQAVATAMQQLQNNLTDGGSSSKVLIV